MNESTITLIDSAGPWPEHAVEDINNARSELMKLKHIELVVPEMCKEIISPVVRVSSKTYKSLDYRLANTSVSYRSFLEGNHLAKMALDSTLDDDTALVILDDDTIQINGIVPCSRVTCSYCPNELDLHDEATKLKDGRRVCHECYAKVFDSILLHGLKGSTNK